MIRRLRSHLLLFLATGLAGALSVSAALAAVTDAPGDNRNEGGLDLRGYRVLYYAVGVENDNDGDDRTATVVHCTNVGSTPTTVAIELFTFNGGFAGDATRELLPGSGATFESQPVDDFSGDELAAEFVFSGSLRILANSSKAKLACTAHLVNPTGVLRYAAHLPLFPQKKLPKLKFGKR